MYFCGVPKKALTKEANFDDSLDFRLNPFLLQTPQFNVQRTIMLDMGPFFDYLRGRGGLLFAYFS